MKATFNVSNTWMFSSNFWRLRIYGLHTFIRPNYHREMHFKAPEAFLTCPVLHILHLTRKPRSKALISFNHLCGE